MKVVVWFSIVILFITAFNSCALFNYILGINQCAKDGCTKQCAENCNYCPEHCDYNYLPADFDSKARKSVDGQVKKYNDNLNKK